MAATSIADLSAAVAAPTGGKGGPQRGVIFDLDGTLVEGRYQAAEAKTTLLKRLGELGVVTSDIDANGSMMDILAEVRSRARPDGAPSAATVEKEIAEVLDRFDAASLSKAKLREGAKPVLDSLAGRGVKLGIVTNSGRAPVAAALVALKLTHYFAVVIAREDVRLLKPSSEGLQTALTRMGCDSTNVAFVGDSWIDIRAAKGANVRAIALVGGLSSPERLERESPDVTIRSLNELLRIV